MALEVFFHLPMICSQCSLAFFCLGFLLALPSDGDILSTNASLRSGLRLFGQAPLFPRLPGLGPLLILEFSVR
jgi:hypothetical protein